MPSVSSATSPLPALLRRDTSIDAPQIQALPAAKTTDFIDGIIRQLAVIAFLASLAWLAHFSQSRNIGFYSDDQTFAVRPLSWSSEDFVRWMRTEMISYPEPQGRPLGFALGVIFAYLGDNLAGVDGMFIVGWLILSLNAALFYYLLRRCFASPIPLLGAIGFLLFPADTTRPFLCHAHILQPALTFMLIAAHLYLGGSLARRICSYFVVTLCLLTYESALLPFMAIPLLETARDHRWRRRFVVHLLTLVTIMVAIGLSRKLGHEYRTEELDGGKTIALIEVAAGSFIGPAVALSAFAWRIWSAIQHLWMAPGDLFAMICAAGVFALVFRLLKRPTGDSAMTDAKRAIHFGAAALSVSYLLSFTHFPPVCLQGQTTSVHLAAVIGASTLFAAFAAMLLRSNRLAASAGIALYLGLLFTWSRVVQDGYVTLWQERQQFWTRLIDVCPDLTDGTLIICDNQLPQPNALMPANCWSDSVVLQQCLAFPASFSQAPQVCCFPSDASAHGWRTWLKRDGSGRVVWDKSPYGREEGSQLVEGNTILLHVDDNGGITRVGGYVDIAGKAFRLKSLAPRGLPRYPTLQFYDILSKVER